MSSDNMFELIQLLKLSKPVEIFFDEPTQVKEEKVEEIKPKRCQNTGCNKKLVLTDFACKCKKFYCAAHRFSDLHSCSFDYKSTGKELLAKQLAEVKGSRVEKI